LTARTAARVALLALAAVATVAAFGSPRLTWENTGLRIDHPRHRGAAALLAASALAAAALSGRSRRAAAGGLAAAAALALLGAHRLAWRVEAVEEGLRERAFDGWTSIEWPDVERVEPRPDALRLRARGGRELVLSVRGLPPEDRTRLERTIARRLRELPRASE
jgi:hypothetical protein